MTTESHDALAALPAALKVVPAAATQIPADELPTYADAMARLARLRTSSRVHLENLGYSRGGRAIPMIAITNAATPDRIDEIRRTAARLAAPEVTHPTIAEPRILAPQLAVCPEGVRVPVLIQSSNFGSEAAQLEALLALAEQLARDESDEIASALDVVALLIVPLINPDGYEAARRHWAEKPGSSGHIALGNQFDIEVTREYLHLVEPETRALGTLVSRWHPFVVWEVHEDGLGLSWAHPETCLCPPMTMFGKPGIDSSIAPSIDDARIYAQHQRFGEAIAKAWAERGYHYLHEPNGAHGWPRFEVPGADGLVPNPEARFTQTMPLRGVPAFITESARAPGSQTWADRVGQKVAAGIAVLKTAADERDPLVSIVADVQGRAAASDPDFFLMPVDQDPFVLGRAVDVLLGHDIIVYGAELPGLGSAVVVPAAQPLRATLEQLLLLERGCHLSLVATIGLRVRPSQRLTDEERAAWAHAALTRVADSASVITAPVLGPGYHRIANTHDGVRMVARLLNTPGAQVRWAAAGTADGEGFVATVPGSAPFLADLVAGLRANLEPADEAGFGAAAQLRLPRVGIWAGQGTLENTYNGTLARWFLHEWGLPYQVLGAADISASTLAGLDALIVPSGSAAAMLTGYDPDSKWQRFPWAPDFNPAPLTPEAVASLRTWVEQGGTYIGIDAGGGRLAGPGFLGLSDAEAAVIPPGTGLVELHIDRPDDQLFDGLRGSWDAAGQWQPGVIRAMYVANPLNTHPGGCGFVVGPASEQLASLGPAVPITGIHHIHPTPQQSDGRPFAAVLRTAAGAGSVVVLGVEPTYRGLFLESARLLANAVLSSVVA